MTKAEIQKWHKKFLDWIENIRKTLRENGVSFECHLVGSAKRHLVIRHHNKGFDLDFQIILHKNKLSEKDVKGLFMALLDPLVVKEGFEYCKDSTSAITIKKVDVEKAKIIVGYDVVIIKNKINNGIECTEILRHHKNPKSESWKFEQLSDMKNASEQFRKIKGHDMWKDLRELY